MKLYVILGYCGDFYCEEEHPVAVATSPESAERLKAAALDARHKYARHENAQEYKTWPSVTVKEMEADVAPPAMEVR